MLQLQVPQHSPRLQYVAQVLGLLLGQSIHLVDAAQPDVPHLVYAPGPPLDGAPHIAAGSLLFEEGATAGAPQWGTWAGLPCLHRAGDVPGDMLASCFLLLADYFLYNAGTPVDAHARPDEKYHVLVAAGHHRRPLLHEYTAALIQQVQQRWPRWQAALPRPDYLVTVDIDHPWEYGHRPLWRQLGGMGKDTLTGQWADAAQRLRVLLGGADRYDPLRLFAHWPADKLRTFWLAGGTHTRDNRLAWDYAPLRQLLLATRQQGIDVGIHPSYETALQPQLMSRQLQDFARATGQAPVQSRQHYLRVQHPHTLQQLAAAGVLEEHTAGFATTTGFAHGMAVPFPWYDLPAERMSPLWRVPFQLMDRTLQKYMQLDVAAAIAHTQQLIDTTHQWGGTFTVLLHNHILCNTREWRGWQHWHAMLHQHLTKPRNTE